MAGVNFGLLGTRETASDSRSRLARVTNEDATLIAHSRNPEQTDEPAHREYHELNRERGRLPGAIRMRIRFKQYATPWYDYLFAGLGTMHELVEPTLWRVTETIRADGGPMYVGILEKS